MTSIRAERSDDIGAIRALTAAAFDAHPFSAGTEPYIVDALRAANALILSLVAESSGRIVGHVAFSPVTVSDGTASWYALGPISVLPERQGRGIGGALVEAGLASLRGRGAAGCVLLGDPGYYGRFGFARSPALTCEGMPAEHVLVLAFSERVPRATFAFHKGFSAKG